MEGRWTMLVCSACGEDAHGIGQRCGANERDGALVPVVPCDDAAIERAAEAIVYSNDVIRDGMEPEMVGWAMELAKRALRAAGETP